MSSPLTANDLMPLIEKLSEDEQLELVRRVLAGRRLKEADKAYEPAPGPDEFSQEDDGLGWEPGEWGDDAPP